MSSSWSDSCSKLVAGKYDVLLDENPALIKKALNGYLERFNQLELELVGGGQDPNSTSSSEQQLGGYHREFKQLRELSKSLKSTVQDAADLRVGELEFNRRKNRYQDIIPFNHTRVVLNSLPSVPNGSDYINASFISGSSGLPRAYIACQGPLKRTLDDFWRMIWETNVSVVIMACNEYESDQLKCELYWPEIVNSSQLYGNIQVTLLKVRRICDDFLIRKFSVKLLQINNNQSKVSPDKKKTDSSGSSSSSSSSDNSDDGGDRITRSDGDSDSYNHLSSDTPELSSDPSQCSKLALSKDPTIVLEERTVCQFHYTTWPDHGAPKSVQPILELLRLVRDVQPAEDKPILVHCSAGCGRTGTICCIDYVWGLLRRCLVEPDFDLYHIISEMRRQRMSMVQTLDQYVLCHRAVAALFADQLSAMQDDNYDNESIYVNFNPVELPMKTALEEDDRQAVQPEDDDDKDNFDYQEEDYGPVFI